MALWAAPTQHWPAEQEATPEDERPRWQPRITPSPPPQRGRPVLAALAGLVVGLLIFAPTGYFVGTRIFGDRSGDDGRPAATTPGGGGTGSLPPYESSQLALNKAKFDGDLATLAESWLPWVGRCTANTDPRGPELKAGEQTRVLCEYSNVNVYFIRYTSIAERDKERLDRTRQHIDAQTLTPGAVKEADKAATSGHTSGSYVEFAYRVGSGSRTRTTCGAWWDDADTPVGAYLVTLWTEGLGDKWEPLRDIWQRHS